MKDQDTSADTAIRRQIEVVLAEAPLKAASFIVTVYGDVAEPRGGSVWIGNLIETCDTVGISETLVRTAVSRLVAADQLAGERAGRRSFYRLTPPAQTEFAAAAEVIFGAAPAPDSWQFVFLPTGADLAALERRGFVRLSPQLAAGPARALEDGFDGLVFDADVASGHPLLAEFAAAHWPLEDHAGAYRRFLAMFTPFRTLLEEQGPPRPDTCLTVRLLLIHMFRAVLLRDPRLPAAALPEDWPGHAARALFAGLYAALSPGADAHVARSFSTLQGPLPNATPATRRRLTTLRR